MIKTKKLNRLFEKWEKDYSQYRGKFKKDGIIDEAKYSTTTPKILFIAKEGNDVDQAPGDFRNWWLTDGIKYSFSHRLSEWAYGILNNFPPLESITYDQKYQALLSVSFMNVKKSGGGSKSSISEIAKHIEENKERLTTEINIIQPEIIIGSLTNSSLWKILFGEISLINSGYDIYIFMWNGIKIVDYYHPSNRYPRAMNYALLKEVIKSKSFKSL